MGCGLGSPFGTIRHVGATSHWVEDHPLWGLPKGVEDYPTYNKNQYIIKERERTNQSDGSSPPAWWCRLRRDEGEGAVWDEGDEKRREGDDPHTPLSYRPDFENLAKLGVAMPVVGGDDRYKASSLLATDCDLCVLTPVNIKDEHDPITMGPGMLDCKGGGNGITCKK
ncbi:hypothetical protein HanPI659440_Chr16g0644361 [Helianthus annuus]|nr:hypothetical protein HanPI659440_Chr16g0644361 [Helianthus annuus]